MQDTVTLKCGELLLCVWGFTGRFRDKSFLGVTSWINVRLQLPHVRPPTWQWGRRPPLYCADELNVKLVFWKNLRANIRFWELLVCFPRNLSPVFSLVGKSFLFCGSRSGVRLTSAPLSASLKHELDPFPPPLNLQHAKSETSCDSSRA